MQCNQPEVAETKTKTITRKAVFVFKRMGCPHALGKRNMNGSVDLLPLQFLKGHPKPKTAGEPLQGGKPLIPVETNYPRGGWGAWPRRSCPRVTGPGVGDRTHRTRTEHSGHPEAATPWPVFHWTGLLAMIKCRICSYHKPCSTRPFGYDQV